MNSVCAPGHSTTAVKLASALTLLLALAANCFVNGQAGLKIAAIEVEGLQRMTAEQVIGTSGLKTGQPFSIESVDEAAQKLADSGLFKRVKYRARTTGSSATVVFEVEESRGGTSAVIFDNFIWFTEAELIEAVRREVPSFAGTAPDAGETINSISRALQQLLKEHNIEATIDYMSSQDSPGSAKQDHIFSMSGISLPVCTFHFPGAKNISEEKLIASSKELAGTDYSRKVASLFAVSNLFPLYREVGQLKATFGQPVGKLDDEKKCKNGVDLTIPVEEGLIYSWEKADWLGNQVFGAPELDAILKMKNGEVANGIKFDQGLKEIRRTYGRKGYIEASVKGEPNFDETMQRVSYKVEVREGPQYKMGNLIVKGFTEASEKLLRVKWPLKAGDVFDDDNLGEFRKKSFNEVMRKLGEEYYSQGKALPTKVDTFSKANRATLTVDVTFELKP